MGKLWQRITYYRHRSELWAIGLAKQVPCLAALPIAMVLCFWWVIAPLPVLLPFILLLQALGPLGGTVLGLVALMVLLLAAPWFFGWYGIAVGLTFGRFTAAGAKEKALVESIHAYRSRAI
ncbi:hypothetical protein [Sinorhizobium sojae]|nr:hypothetical protein [Sinorhizobium sojae]